MPTYTPLDLQNASWALKPSPVPATQSQHLSFTQIQADPAEDPNPSYLRGLLGFPGKKESKEEGWSSWQKCSQMPSLAHVELLRNGRIRDPYKGLVENEVQWVGETPWIYRCRFSTPKDLAPNEAVDLVFEGLDTFADVYLNGELLFSNDNQFVAHRTDVKSLLRSDGNELHILFHSAFVRGREIEEKHLGKGKHLGLSNGDPARLWVRKSGTNWGWDWGPVLMTSGPWRPIVLERYTVRIEDFYPKATLSDSLAPALTVSFLVVPAPSAKISPRATVYLVDPLNDNHVIASNTIDVHQGKETIVDFQLLKGDVELWLATGQAEGKHGKVGRLYNVKVDIKDTAETLLATETKSVGFRRIRLVQDPFKDQPGTSFYFEINNEPLFCGGSNWIPCDNFLTDVTPQRYRAWLQLMLDGHQNMVRIWGGGVYEDESFYDACSEMGILLWNDFMFACGQYPGHPEFIESVKREAEYNVKRVRHHPCMAIWCSNNEDYQMAAKFKLDWDPNDKDGDWLKTNFPARELYERIFPEIVGRLSETPCHPGSPWNDEGYYSPIKGDVHEWNVYHGQQKPYQEWDKLGGRFVSEFGMIGFPDIKTVDYYLDGDKSERYPQSHTVFHHNKAAGGERRTEIYVIENFRHTFDMDSYVYITRLMQSEAIETAYRLWRREFRGPGKYYCAGALVWQLNDCWPTQSWAIVDYFLRPKPAYFAVKRALRPLAVGMRRYHQRHSESRYTAAFYRDEHWVEIWGCNSRSTEATVTVIIDAFDHLTGEKFWTKRVEGVKIPGLGAKELERIEIPKQKGDEEGKREVVMAARLVDPRDDTQVESRFAVWHEPFKYLRFPSPVETKLQVDISYGKSGTGKIKVSAARPVKGLCFTFSEDVQKMSDDCLDVMPGDPQTIEIGGGFTADNKVEWKYLWQNEDPALPAPEN